MLKYFFIFIYFLILFPINSYSLENYNLIINKFEKYKFDQFIKGIVYETVLLEKNKIWFKGKLQFGDKVFPVNFRLRGDLHTHWRGKKKSLRLKFTNNTLVKNQKEINLIVPHDKDYGIDYLINYIAENDLGLLTPNYEFINLSINDENYGVYYLSEQPSNEWMERKEYPANPIFNFEQNWTLFVDHLNTRYSGYKDKEDNFNLNVIDLGIKNYKNSFKKPEFEFQKKLVFEFYQIITSGHKINDIHNHINLESFSKIFALSCFFGSDHSLHFGDNTRIFYNNTNQLLELSPWDIGFGDIQKNTLCLKLLSKKSLQHIKNIK